VFLHHRERRLVSGGGGGEHLKRRDVRIGGALFRGVAALIVVGAARPPQGRREGSIEAVARSLIMGFRADVVFRVAALGAGSQIDIRSASRYGWHDAGANASRVRQLLEEIDDAASGDSKAEPERRPAPAAPRQPAKR
jgi:hypothetical protein